MSNQGKWLAGAYGTILVMALIALSANPGDTSCPRYYNDDIFGYLFCRLGNWIQSGNSAAILAGLISLGAIIVFYWALFTPPKRSN